jgi:phage terminase small subunit
MSVDEAWLWDGPVEERIEAGVVGASDGPMAWSMCELWGLYRGAVVEAKKDPINKEARIAVTGYWHAFEVAASRFGMNPSDRSKLRMDAPKASDPKGKGRFFKVVG